MGLIRKLKNNLWMFRALPYSVWFNLRNLPFRQAAKLPILIYKPQSVKTSGRIRLDAPAKFGMIRMGHRCVGIYPNNGIIFENRGEIVFKGRASIGNNSAIAIGPSGHLVLEDFFRATAALKLVCYSDVLIEKSVLIGWNCMICDTDFHSSTFVKGGHSKGYGSIKIGTNTWIANSCKIYKNVSIPPNSVIASDTIVCSNRHEKENLLLGNDHSVEVLKEGVYLDMSNDKIEYE